MTVGNENEPEDGKLVASLTPLFARRRNFEPIMNWLASADSVSQNNLVALFRACLSLSPTSTADNLKLGLELMGWCARNSTDQVNSVEVSLTSAYFNSVLVEEFMNFRRHNLTRAGFWKKHRMLCIMVLPPMAAEACFSCTSSFVLVEAQLSECVRSRELGRSLFAKAYGEVANQKAGTIIKASVEALKHQMITREVLDANKKTLAQQVRELGRGLGDEFQDPTMCQVMFLGVEIQVSANSLFDEYSLHMWSYLKTLAIEEQTLPYLYAEASLMEATIIGTDAGIDDSLVQDMYVVRRLRRNRSRQRYVGEDKMKTAILELLPNDDKQVSVASSLQGLAKLVKSPLNEWQGPGMQTIATAVLECAQSICAEKVPKANMSNEPFLNKCMRRMSLWCAIVLPGASDAAQLRGEASALAAFQHYQRMNAASEDIGMAQLQRLSVVSWLLLADASATILQWMEAKAQLVAAEVAENPGAKGAVAPTKRKVGTKSHLAPLFK